MRIVSLLGSATEIVYALGLESMLVGVSHECDYPDAVESLPRVSRPRFDPAGMTSGEVDRAVRQCMVDHGSVYEVDVAALAKLRPDVVLTQAVCEVCAVPTGSAEEAVRGLPGRVEVLSLDAHDLAGILETIERVAASAGLPDRGSDLRRRLEARLDELASGHAGAPRPRVLLLEWLEPPFAPGHWVPEMVEAAGGENLAGEKGRRSEQIGWSDVEGLDPDVLLVEPCGYDLGEAAADADRYSDRLRQIAPRAIQEGRAWVLHSGWFSRSGPRVFEGIEALSRIIRCDPASPPSPDIARRWG